MSMLSVLIPIALLFVIILCKKIPKIGGNIHAALIISGTNDLCTPLIAKTMYDRIPDARWELFDGCRHMCFVEDTERYIRLLAGWLDETEKNGCL